MLLRRLRKSDKCVHHCGRAALLEPRKCGTAPLLEPRMCGTAPLLGPRKRGRAALLGPRKACEISVGFSPCGLLFVEPHVLPQPLRRWLLSLLAAAMIAILAGCGTSTTNVQNPPPPPSTPVSIAFQPAPATTISLVATTRLTAVVTNDPSDSGVDWSLLCQSTTNCGTLLPLHTASGTAATYTPPPVISGNAQRFTIEAFATSDHSKNVVAGLTVTGFASNLKGTYVFATSGIDANGPFQLAGVIILDGNGGITSGEQTHSDSLLSVTDPITGGSYYIGPDGRGSLTINTADQNIGQLGVENLSLVFLSSAKALIATLDNPNLQPSFETSSGTLDLQTATTAPTGGYAFAVNGTDVSSQPMALGGVLKIDSPATISGAGSVADQDDAGTVFPSATISGTVTAPDSLGSVKFNLTAAFSPKPIQFTGYIVDAQHMRLIESDNTGSGTGLGSTSGIAIAQGAATGTFTSTQSFAGNYVFDILGQDLSLLPTSLASVGVFSADTSGNLNNGYIDELLDGIGVQISDSFTGTYTLDSTGTGRVDSQISFSGNVLGPELIFYLTGNGNPPLVLDAEATHGSLGVGLANPQAAPPFSFNGKYGLSFTQGVGPLENDATGPISVNGASNTLSGVVDTNLSFSPLPNTPITGTFGTVTGTGRFTGALANSFFPTPGTNPSTLSMAFYLIDSGHGYFIETDSLTSGELSFGYFATRTAACPTCP